MTHAIRAPEQAIESMSCLPQPRLDEPPQRQQRRRHHVVEPSSLSTVQEMSDPPNSLKPIKGCGRARGQEQPQQQRHDEKHCARLFGNPFEEQQQAHKHEQHKGRQVVPRLVDCSKIHPTAAAMDAQLEKRSCTFEHSPYTILPDREKRFVRSRRMSSEPGAGSSDHEAVHRVPSLRLRDNSDETRLRRLLPTEPSKDDVRRDYANLVAQQRGGGGYLEAMIQNSFPIPRGPNVDCQFPPIHVRQTPRKYDSHLPFGPSVPPAETLANAPSGGRRVFHQPLAPLPEQQPSLVPRGHEPPRGQWNVISGDR